MTDAEVLVDVRARIDPGDIGAWPPFLDWLRAHDTEPRNCWRVEIDGDEAVFHLYRRSDDGKYVLATAGEPDTYVVRREITQPVPTR